MANLEVGVNADKLEMLCTIENTPTGGLEDFLERHATIDCCADRPFAPGCVDEFVAISRILRNL